MTRTEVESEFAVVGKLLSWTSAMNDAFESLDPGLLQVSGSNDSSFDGSNPYLPLTGRLFTADSLQQILAIEMLTQNADIMDEYPYEYDPSASPPISQSLSWSRLGSRLLEASINSNFPGDGFDFEVKQQQNRVPKAPIKLLLTKCEFEEVLIPGSEGEGGWNTPYYADGSLYSYGGALGEYQAETLEYIRESVDGRDCFPIFSFEGIRQLLPTGKGIFSLTYWDFIGVFE